MNTASSSNANSVAHGSQHEETRHDSLAVSLISTATLTVLQKFLGLGRHLAFLTLMTDAELGRFSVAFNLLLAVCSLAVLGIPSTLCRYVEQYRRLGQLASFTRRIFVGCAVLTAPIVVMILLMPEWFAVKAFGDSQAIAIMQLFAVALGLIVANNVMNEMLSAHRQFRAAALLQLLAALVFMLGGVTLLLFTPFRETAALASYAASNLVVVLGGLVVLLPIFRQTQDVAPPPRLNEFWKKMLSYSLWNSIGGFLNSLFFVLSNYMIIHYSGLDAIEAAGMAGQFTSGTFVPAFLMQLVVAVGATMLPYMSHDWEQGRHGEVGQKLGTALKLLSLSCCLASGLILMGSPLLFDLLLRGRFNTGLAILATAFTLYIWQGLLAVLQNFLWCTERAYLPTLALLPGLMVSGALSWCLIGRFGLQGVVCAAQVGVGLTVIVMLLMCWRLGLQMSRGLLLAFLFPLGVSLGTIPAAVLLVLGMGLIRYTNEILTAEEKSLCLAKWLRLRAQLFRPRLCSASSKV